MRWQWWWLLVTGLSISDASLAVTSNAVECTTGDLVRTVEVRLRPSEDLMCDVFYKKPSEGDVEESLWTARNDLSFCNDRYAQFVGKLMDAGWECETQVSEDARDVVADVLAARDPLGERPALADNLDKDGVNAGSDSAGAVAADTVAAVNPDSTSSPALGGVESDRPLAATAASPGRDSIPDKQTPPTLPTRGAVAASSTSAAIGQQYRAHCESRRAGDDIADVGALCGCVLELLSGFGATDFDLNMLMLLGGDAPTSGLMDEDYHTVLEQIERDSLATCRLSGQ